MPRRLVFLALTLAAPALARAGGLLDTELSLTLAPPAAAPDLTVRPALVLASASDPGKKDDEKKQAAPTPAPGDLDFDLLGAATPPAEAPDSGDMKLRRKLLTAHQAVGLGLVALQLGTTAVGQLNYRDKFGTPANTGKWRVPHAALAYATTAVFALNGALAIAAPAPVKREWRLDRAMVHRISMFTAAAGMAAQVGLGVYTASREGYVNQRDMAKTHLYIGYGTLAALLTGVGVLVF